MMPGRIWRRERVGGGGGSDAAAAALRVSHAAAWVVRGSDGAPSQVCVFGGAGPRSRPVSALTFIELRSAGADGCSAVVVDAGGGPAARWKHASAQHPGDGCGYVHGGAGKVGVYGDLWCFCHDRLAWREVDALGDAPAARFGHSAIFDSSGRYFFVVGGTEAAAHGPSGGVWHLDMGAHLWRRVRTVADRISPRTGFRLCVIPEAAESDAAADPTSGETRVAVLRGGSVVALNTVVLRLCPDRDGIAVPLRSSPLASSSFSPSPPGAASQGGGCVATRCDGYVAAFSPATRAVVEFGGRVLERRSGRHSSGSGAAEGAIVAEQSPPPRCDVLFVDQAMSRKSVPAVATLGDAEHATTDNARAMLNPLLACTEGAAWVTLSSASPAVIMIIGGRDATTGEPHGAVFTVDVDALALAVAAFPQAPPRRGSCGAATLPLIRDLVAPLSITTTATTAAAPAAASRSPPESTAVALARRPAAAAQRETTTAGSQSKVQARRQQQQQQQQQQQFTQLGGDPAGVRGRDEKWRAVVDAVLRDVSPLPLGLEENDAAAAAKARRVAEVERDVTTFCEETEALPLHARYDRLMASLRPYGLDRAAVVDEQLLQRESAFHTAIPSVAQRTHRGQFSPSRKWFRRPHITEATRAALRDPTEAKARRNRAAPAAAPAAASATTARAVRVPRRPNSAYSGAALADALERRHCPRGDRWPADLCALGRASLIDATPGGSCFRNCEQERQRTALARIAEPRRAGADCAATIAPTVPPPEHLRSSLVTPCAVMGAAPMCTMVEHDVAARPRPREGGGGDRQRRRRQ